MKRTKVVVDASPSIAQYGITGKVLETLNSYVDSLRDAATVEDVYEIAAVKFSSAQLRSSKTSPR